MRQLGFPNLTILMVRGCLRSGRFLKTKQDLDRNSCSSVGDGETIWEGNEGFPWDFQASTLEWIAMSSSRGSSRPRDRTRISFVSCIGKRILYHFILYRLQKPNFSWNLNLLVGHTLRNRCHTSLLWKLLSAHTPLHLQPAHNQTPLGSD